MNVLAQIKELNQKDKVVLYMKGTPDFPQCGFSAKVVAIMQHLGHDFQAYNVLDNDDLRQGIKEYGQWPTIPQLYIQDELVGGCDIITAMYESGELQEILDKQ